MTLYLDDFNNFDRPSRATVPYDTALDVEEWVRDNPGHTLIEIAEALDIDDTETVRHVLTHPLSAPVRAVPTQRSERHEWTFPGDRTDVALYEKRRLGGVISEILNLLRLDDLANEFFGAAVAEHAQVSAVLLDLCLAMPPRRPTDDRGSTDA